jgi:hypothetical protein
MLAARRRTAITAAEKLAVFHLDVYQQGTTTKDKFIRRGHNQIGSV